MLLMGSSFMKGSIQGGGIVGEGRKSNEPGGEVVVEEEKERPRSAFGGSIEDKPMKYEYDKKLKIDPVNYYGFGVVSYFQLL
jgi:hypothetical protein